MGPKRAASNLGQISQAVEHFYGARNVREIGRTHLAHMGGGGSKDKHARENVRETNEKNSYASKYGRSFVLCLFLQTRCLAHFFLTRRKA